MYYMFFIKIIMKKNSCKIFLSVFLLSMLCITMQAQTVVIAEQVDTVPNDEIIGPNRLWYAHGLFQLASHIGPQEPGMHTDIFSYSYTYGGRVKLRLWSWESLVADWGYRHDRFSIKQQQNKRSPLNTGRHQHERVSVHNLSFAFCNRLNFGRRGNIMGFWVDMGVYGDWAFVKNNVYVDRYYDSNSAIAKRYKVRTRITHLQYIEKFNYGFTLRSGGDYFGVFANYRMNDLIKNASTTSYNDLPKLTVGVEFYLQED
jgi:hypothetical protein